MALSKVQGEYAAWLLTTKRERDLHGLPQSDRDFARQKGVTDRTLRRWRTGSQEFQEHLADLRRRLNEEHAPEGWVPPEELAAPRESTDVRTLPKPEPRLEKPRVDEDPEFDDRLSPDEQQYAIVKAEIARQAAGGDAKALELYLKYWGADHLRRERAENETLRGMSDEQLVREVIELLGVETVATVLAAA